MPFNRLPVKSVSLPTTATILVVEDDVGIRELLSQVLDDDGYDVIAVRTLAEAIGQLARTVPKVIVLDLLLGDGDGHRVVEACRQDRRLANVPVIVLTGRPRVQELDGTVVLSKPFDLDCFASTVERLVLSQSHGST